MLSALPQILNLRIRLVNQHWKKWQMENWTFLVRSCWSSYPRPTLRKPRDVPDLPCKSLPFPRLLNGLLMGFEYPFFRPQGRKPYTELWKIRVQPLWPLCGSTDPLPPFCTLLTHITAQELPWESKAANINSDGHAICWFLCVSHYDHYVVFHPPHTALKSKSKVTTTNNLKHDSTYNACEHSFDRLKWITAVSFGAKFLLPWRKIISYPKFIDPEQFCLLKWLLCLTKSYWSIL